MTGEDQSQPQVEGQVGLQLRQAREKLGLSVSDIADQQHLRPCIIQAIEEGDYNKVDTELFLKGYVRTYARQVNLDPDSVISALDAELEPLREQREREHLANPLVDIERKKRRKRQIAKLVILIVFLGVSGLLAYNIFLKPIHGGEMEGAEGATNETLTQQPDESPGENISEPQSPLDEASADGQPGLTPAPLDTSEVAVASADSASPAGVNDADQAPLDGERPVVGPGEALPDAVAPGLLPAEESPTEPAPVQSVSLEMEFSADCWIQVTDGAGNRLASALRTDGDVLDVRGQPPLKVVVGAMSAVESLAFQDEPMDLGSFRVVNNRAEFTLEP
ncbi:RodZ domain-containing protein [Marinobacter sp. VGCF2001]|uniref:RodZ domain-containing protein n=1 Tax=Marinobacter sp. VGCF2001 TaxID=3417189 RepID=UPI003CF5708E